MTTRHDTTALNVNDWKVETSDAATIETFSTCDSERAKSIKLGRFEFLFPNINGAEINIKFGISSKQIPE